MNLSNLCDFPTRIFALRFQKNLLISLYILKKIGGVTFVIKADMLIKIVKYIN